MNKTIAEILKPIGETFGIKRRANLYFNSVSLEDNEGKIKIIPVGKFPDHPDGGHEVTSDDINAMVENIKKNKMDILFDYGHESLWNPKASAAGWSDKEGVEARADGLYIDYPNLTPKARLMVDEDEYRYLSPVYKLNRKSGEAEIISVALTNTPFFKSEIEHLKNSFIQLNGGKEMNQKIFEFFNLSPEGDENQILEKINSVRSENGISNIDELKINSERPSASDLFVNNAINDGKILPTEADLWKAWFEKDPDAARTRIAGIKTNSALPEKLKFDAEPAETDQLTDATNFIKSQGR